MSYTNIKETQIIISTLQKYQFACQSLVTHYTIRKKGDKRLPFIELDRVFLSLFQNFNLLNDVTLSDIINHIQAVNHLAEAGVVTIKVSGIIPAMANEKLAATGISATVGH